MPTFVRELFLNPLLLGGLALVVIPVVLHLLLRAKPKPLTFPALQLILQRKTQTTRRLRLQHWWLLLLRMLVIAAIVFALARPSLPAANYSLTRGEAIRLGMVLTFFVSVYLGIVRGWRNSGMPPQTLSYRESMLRTGFGIAAFLTCLLLVFWPYRQRVAAEIVAPPKALAEEIPVTAIFLVDTSWSMEYRYENETRLQQAQRLATDYAGNMPRQSRMAILDSTATSRADFRTDQSVLSDDIKRLKTQATARPLSERLVQALRAMIADRELSLSASTGNTDVGTSTVDTEADDSAEPADAEDPFLRELYVFTDLTAVEWDSASRREVRQLMDANRWLNVYLIDLGVVDPINSGIIEVTPSRESLPRGTPLLIDVTMSHTGPEPVSRRLEVWDSDDLPGGKMPVDEKVQPLLARDVTLTPGTPLVETFQLTDLTKSVSSLQIQFPDRTADETFRVDNKRCVTVHVQNPPDILLIEGKPGAGDYFKEALAPTELVKIGRAPFRVRQRSPRWFEEFLDEALQSDVIGLVNVASLPTDVWTQLEEYVAQGHGLLVFTGSEDVDPVSYFSEAAKRVLPGELIAQRSFRTPESLSLTAKDHPLLAKLFATNAVSVLESRRVRESWLVEPFPDSTVIAWFTQRNNQPTATPALIERAIGAGRVVMLTTAVSPQGWSNLARPSWQFLMFSHELLRYLSPNTIRCNFSAGDVASLPVPAEQELTEYLLRKPSGEQIPRELPADAVRIVVEDTAATGVYTLLDANDKSDFRSGFSVTGPAEQSDFARLEPVVLDEFFGPERYKVGSTPAELERIISERRIGKELFPQVVMLAIVFFCLEHLISNRFYRSAESTTSGSTAAASAEAGP